MKTARCRPWFVVVLTLAWLSSGAGLGRPATGAPPLDRGPTTQTAPIDLIVVPEDDEWLLALAAPLASRLGDSRGSRPLLLALETVDGESVRDAMDRFASRSCLVVATTPEEYPDLRESALATDRPADRPAATLSTFYASGEPTPASLALASEYWSSSDSLILAPSEEPAAAIIAATLAAHLGAPLVVVDRYRGHGPLSKAVEATARRLGASRRLLVSDRSEWRAAGAALEVIGSDAAARRVVEILSPDRVSGVIVARDPRGASGASGAGATSWAAPLLSLARSAPVVLASSGEALDAEARVEEFLRSNGLRPNTVTILADHGSIGVLAVRNPSLGDYCVEVEPCSGGAGKGAAAYGVGRIQARTRAGATRAIARTLARRASTEGRPLSAVMIANPETQYGRLPLCETISRVTAEELKNWRIDVTEFYGMPVHPAGLEESATRADLIIFQGHVVDLPFFNAPSPFELEDVSESEAPASDEDGREWEGLGDRASALEPQGLPEGRPFDDAPLDDAPLDDVPPESGSTDDDVLLDDAFLVEAPPSDSPLVDTFLGDVPPEDSLDDGACPDATSRTDESLGDALLDVSSLWITSEAFAPPKFTAPLDGFPLVVLQSCHSLDDNLARQAFEAGAVALLGTTTNVHSASGSAFVKVFCDNLLYRGASLGEALRDTRNYFLCLGKLKASRGHRELGKPYRVALSFRLWGDPELRFPLPAGRAPRRPGVVMGLSESSSVLVWAPDRKLPTVETEEYLARMFPGSVAAGIVKRLKHRPVRRVLPLYFARIDLPEGADFLGRPLTVSPEHAERCSLLADPLSRFLYALYLPEKDCGGDYVEIPLLLDDPGE